MKKYSNIFMIILCFLLESCNDNFLMKNYQTVIIEGKTMGTSYRVIIPDILHLQLKQLQEEINKQLIKDNQEISNWQLDSSISRFNKYYGTNPQKISLDMARIISYALHIGKKTNNMMDITIEPLINLWGFGPNSLHILKRLPNIQEIYKTKKIIGLKYLRLIETNYGQWLQKLLPGIHIDLSTLGEGYATDHLAVLLEQLGINRYLVSVGGAVFTQGLSLKQKPWVIAIRTPSDLEETVYKTVSLEGHGISTAGSYNNYYEFKKKHIVHILNPRTGQPIEHDLVSVTVISSSALTADAWDTGLIVLGTEKAKQIALQEKLAVFFIIKTNNGFSSWMSPQFSSFII